MLLKGLTQHQIENTIWSIKTNLAHKQQLEVIALWILSAVLSPDHTHVILLLGKEELKSVCRHIVWEEEIKHLSFVPCWI